MSLKDYLLKVVPDFVLVLAASVCMTMVTAQGFYVSSSLQFSFVGVILSLVLLLPLYLSTYKRSLALPAIVGFAVVAVIAIIVGFVTSTSGNALEDTEGNNAIFCIVGVVVTGLMFGLSRNRVGFFFLILASLLTMGFIQFAYHEGLVVPSLGAFFCLVILFVYQEYCESISQSESAGRASTPVALLTTIAAMAIPALIACVVFFGIIAPLAPDHVILKLFTDYRALETVEVNNPYKFEEVEDPDLKSETMSDEVLYGNNPIDTDTTGITLGDASAFMDSSIQYTGEAAGYNPDEDDGDVEEQTYEVPLWFWLLLIPIALVAILDAALIRLLLRRRWEEKLWKKPASQQIEALYVRMLKGFGAIGLGAAPSQTPWEFAEDSSQRLVMFTDGTDGADWQTVAAAYMTAHYGMMEPSEDDMAGCWKFYSRFCKNARGIVGRPKYCLKYFWIL